ncbi:cysteine-rich CWC family protein [Polaromonas aquatica]|uniref:cysteine-rich CWC family protein n=1 Tax=Polaromonas aquatica TaxID=332657 RepID=UPI003D659067
MSPQAAAPTTSAPANTSVCPRCGAGFHCGMMRSEGPPRASNAPTGGSALHEVKSVGADTAPGDAECWCVQLPHIMPVPSERSVQPEGSALSCFCPACLKQITDERSRPSSPAPSSD